MNKRYDWRILAVFMVAFTMIGTAVIFTVKEGAPIWTLILAMCGSQLFERFRHE